MRFLDPFYYIERKNQPQGGGKGGGGDSDASAMLAYGQKGIDLQKEIYDTNRADAQPWYQAGTASVNQLAKLMGLNGTGANSNPSSRQSLLDQYKDQFTTTNETTTEGTAGNPNWGPNTAYIMEQLGYRPSNFDIYQQNQGTAPVTTKTSTTDQAALNAYVDDLLAKQGAANESDPLFGSLAKNFSMDDFNADPGYQFRLGEGQKALERKLNASGKTYSPEAAKALMEYNQNFGSNEYNNSYNRFNIDQDNLFNRLATISGFGQTASGQVANSGTNYANAGMEQYNGMGNAVTSANLANKANNSSMFNTLLGAGAKLGAAYLSSDERLKENIEFVGIQNGHELFSFNYKAIPSKTYIGVMAQKVLETNPEAVLKDSEGWYMVNYDALGLRMVEVMKDAPSCH